MDAVLEQINSSGKAFIDFALPMLIQSSVLIVVLLGLDAILHKRARAVLRYWIWMIILVKLLLPPTLAFPTSPTYWFSDGLRSFVTGKSFPAETPATRSAVTNIPPEPSARSRSSGAASLADNADLQPAPVPSAGADRVTAPAMLGSLITWQGYVLLAWLASVVVMMTLLIQRALFVRSLVAQSETASDAMTSILQFARQQMHVTTRVGLRLSQAIASPSVCGLVRPIILMPQSLSSKVSEQRFKAILLHELAHIKRGDLWVSCIQTIVQIVYIYHPLLWVANAMIRKVREQAADETVLVALGEEADDYPKTLLDVSRLAFGSSALSLRFLGVAESKKTLHRRIKHMLTRPVPQSARIGVLGAIAILVVAAVLLPMARAEKSSKETPATGPVTAADATENAAPAGESNTIVDPNTGLKFTVAKKITGENDVIVTANKLRQSPNGKLLLYKGQVVPLDGSKAFKLEALHGTEDAAWSSDGRMIAYRDKLATWLLPVSPETGRPTGPARKLLDEQLYWDECEILWSRDSQWIVLAGYYNGYQHRVISVQDGSSMQPPDYIHFSLRSPDQKSLAYFKPHNGVWTAPVQGGASHLAVGEIPWGVPQSVTAPLWWSPDGQWLLCGLGRLADNHRVFRFVHLADHREVDLKFPEQVGLRALGVSPDGKKLHFYKSSYEWRDVFKVASIRGGDPTELRFARNIDIGRARTCGPFSLDSQRWFFLGYKPGIGGQPGTWTPYMAASPTADPVEVKLPEEVRREGAINWWSPERWLFSPDGKQLIRKDQYVSSRGEMLDDLYVIPISLEKAQSTGPATLIFKDCKWLNGDLTWSPDLSRLAISAMFNHEVELWAVPTDGSLPRQLTHSPEEAEWGPKWSPDGKFIAYNVYSEGSPGQVSLYVIPSDGGVPRRLWTKPGRDMGRYQWFPNSKEIGLVSDDALVAVTIADGSVRPFLKFAEVGFTQLQWSVWSRDGQTLGLLEGEEGESGPITLFHASDKRIEVLSDPDPVGKSYLRWTGDSQAISYRTGRSEKVRPAGLIYEIDIEEAWTQAKNIVPGDPQAGASPITVPEAPPLVNGEFRDDFDDDTRYWTFQDDGRESKDRVCVHEVQNGELVLENTRATIGVPEWTNYVVTVKMCVKRAGTWGVGFRRGQDGEYYLGTGLVNRKKGPWLGIRYPDAYKLYRRIGMIAEPSYNFALDKWYTIQVEVNGPHIVARVDGQPVIDVSDESCPRGPVALISGVGSVHFDDFSVRLLQ